MSEQNLATILDGVEEVYRAYRRHGTSLCSWFSESLNELCVDVTLALTRLIINGITSHSSLLDSFVVLHAAFVSSLHRLIGVEFGTSIWQPRYHSAHRAKLPSLCRV
jgi:nucleolar MIF4G domain-containing protein 1